MGHITLRIITKNDINGNPRRGWIVWDKNGHMVSFIEEGYTGRNVLKLHNLGDALCLGEISVPVSEYAALCKRKAK